MNEICFGILEFNNLDNVDNLQYAINMAIQQGANTFILHVNHPYINEIIKLRKKYSKKSSNIKLKIVSPNNSIIKNPFGNNQSIFNEIKNFSLICIDVCGLSEPESWLKISDFIVFNSYKCIGDINLKTLNLFKKLHYRFSMIDINSLTEICIPDILQCDNSSPIDTSDIILMD